ncbi:MAG: hypothetical protein AAFW89_13785 [Bacteroidota bacterium]
MKYLLSLVSLILLSQTVAWAQFGEPEVRNRVNSRNLYDEGFRRGIGFNFSVTDFGIGAGAEYRIGLDQYWEGIISLKGTALRDPSEQIFVDFFFGTRTIPNKYRRVASFPLQFGLKRRLFPEQISDNFRVFTAMTMGPTMAISFDYFDDRSGDEFRQTSTGLYGFAERPYDLLSGYNNAEIHWGLAGEFAIGFDLGDNFGSMSSIRFGYNFNYFPNGIQIMEPVRPNLNPSTGLPQCGNPGEPIPCVVSGFDVEPFNDPRDFFGTAQITFVFGRMW